jgi:hypothetical protein
VAFACVIATGPVVVEDSENEPGHLARTGQPPASAGQDWQDHPDFRHWEFGFELSSDPLAEDLSRLLEHRRTTYTDADTYGSALTEIDGVRSRIREQAGDAAAILRDELSRLDPLDAGVAIQALTLLDEVSDQPEAVDALLAFVMSPEPDYEPSTCGSRSCSSAGHPGRLARRAAMLTLQAASRRGSALATDALFGAAQSLDPHVRRNAVRHYLIVRPGRTAAKSELRSVLRTTERHWLHSY